MGIAVDEKYLRYASGEPGIKLSTRQSPNGDSIAFNVNGAFTVATPPPEWSSLWYTPTISFRHLPPPDENDWFHHLLKSKWEISELGEPHHTLGKLELLVESP